MDLCMGRIHRSANWAALRSDWVADAAPVQTVPRDGFCWVGRKEQEPTKTETRGRRRKTFPGFFEKWPLTGQNAVRKFTAPLLQGGAAW